jgi:flagellar basal-body rod protein FlgB
MSLILYLLVRKERRIFGGFSERRNFAAPRQAFAAISPSKAPGSADAANWHAPCGHPCQTTETTMSEGLFGIHGAALEVRAQRLGMLGSNIANAATPGYKARDVDFAAALEARLRGADAGAAAGSAVQYRVPVMPSLDGNTVEMSVEQTAFAETAVAYSATLGFLRGRVESVTRALKGE